jgi:hypothetical protein
LFFRLVGWVSAVALTAGVAILSLDVAGIRFARITTVTGVTLVIAGFWVSGVFAMIEVFFFSDRPRRERWLEYYRQSILPFKAIEDLIGHHRRKASHPRRRDRPRH